jgi:pimeloyl-ACP methyl ester carboxylesterase
MKSIQIFLLGILFTGGFLVLGLEAQAETHFVDNTHITSDTTWSAEGSPYVISGRLIIDKDATLTILPGSHVVLTAISNSGFDVNGTFRSEGTAEHPIIITSSVVDSSAAGSYVGIQAHPLSEVSLKFTNIFYAQYAVYSQKAKVTMHDSILRNGLYGAYAVDSVFDIQRSIIENMWHPVVFNSMTMHKSTTSGNTIRGSTYSADAIRIVPSMIEPEFFELHHDVPYAFTGGTTFGAGLKSIRIYEGVEVVYMRPQGPGDITNTLRLVGQQELVVNGTEENQVVLRIALEGVDGAQLNLKHTKIIVTTGVAINAYNTTKVNLQNVHITGGATLGMVASAGSHVVATNTHISGVRLGVNANTGAVLVFNGGVISNAERGMSLAGGVHVTITNILFSNLNEAFVSEDVFSVGVNTGTVFQNSFTNNGTAFVLKDTEITFIDNAIFKNQFGAYAPDNGPLVVMRGNWWGHETGPNNLIKNPSGMGDSVSNQIDFGDWKTQGPDSVNQPPDPDTQPEPDPEPNPNPEPVQRIPVVLIPGIMGSEIYRNYGNNAQIWPSVTNLILSPTDAFLNDLAFLPEGIENPTTPMRVGDVIREIQPPLVSSQKVYQGMIDTFIAAGYREGENLFVFPYDWRLSVTNIAESLRSTLNGIQLNTSSQKVHVVGHSMGGLVIKEYVDMYGTDVFESITYIGTPHVGSMKATKMLLYGDSMGIGVGKIKVLNANRAKHISQNMPGVFALLPSKAYSDMAMENEFKKYGLNTASNYILGADYEVTKNFMISQEKNISLLQQAEEIHERIYSRTINTVPVYNFMGCTTTDGDPATISGIALKKRISETSNGKKLTNDYQLLYTHGDGVVPSLSAGAVYSDTAYTIRDVAHSRLPSATGVAEVLLSHYLHTPLVVGGSVSSTQGTSCVHAGKAISIHGGGLVTVIDSLGNVLNDSETVSVDSIGGSTFVYVPDSFTGMLRIESTDATEPFLTAYVRTIDSEGITVTQEYFHLIERPSGDSYYVLAISPDSAFHVFNLEDSLESAVMATTILSGDSLFDITPPKTTAVVSTDKIDLFAEDENSGILFTEYSFDGIEWSYYNEPLKNQEDFLMFFSTDKAGNVEEIQTVSVKEDILSDDTSGDHQDDAVGGTESGDILPPPVPTPYPAPIPSPAPAPYPQPDLIIHDGDLIPEILPEQNSNKFETGTEVARVMVPRNYVAVVQHEPASLDDHMNAINSAHVYAGANGLTHSIWIVLAILCFLLLIILIILSRTLRKREDELHAKKGSSTIER